MTRAYVLDPTTRDVLGLVDQSWEKLAYTRRYFGMDTFTMSIQRARLWASTLEKGRLLYLPDEGDRIFLIEQIQSVAEGSAANDLMTVSGRSLEGIGMAERLVIPPAGQAYDRQTSVAAETAMKHYVTDHASEAATDVDRRLPGLNVVASAGSGAAVTVAGRYQHVFDIVKEIGLLSGIGWEILYNPTTDKFDFDVIVGVDRSTSVFFDFAFETLERWEELDSLVDSKTVAVVAGQGEGEEREVRTRWQGSEPTGFARREVFVDARDIELGQTAELDARGDAFLKAASGERRLEAGIHQYGSFRYGTHWDMGDLVLVRNEERGISYTARVVEVEKAFESSSSAPVVTAIIDRPFPTLKEQVQGAGAKGGVVDYPVLAGATGAIVIWPAAAIPDGYLLCDGQAVSRSTYAELFAIIGTTFGAGDGSTTFNVPNLKGRTVVGINPADASFDAIGETGGSKTHTHAGHSNHVVTQPAAHAALSHSVHSGTAVGDHAAQSHSAHSGTAVSAHAAHSHETPFIDNGAQTLSTTQSVFGTGTSRTRNWTGAYSAASGSYPVAMTQSVTVGAHTVTQPSAHSDHPILSHSVTQPSAHSDHASQSHSGTAVDAHSAHDTPSSMNPYLALHFIIKT